MPRFVLGLTAVALIGSPLWAAPPAEVEKRTVFPYPARAAVVVSLNGYDTARERLTKMLSAGLPDEATFLGLLLDAQMKKLFEGRALTGVRKDGRIFMVVPDIREVGGDNAVEAVLVPVTSYTAFRDAFLTADERKSLTRGANGVESLNTSFAGAGTLYLTELKGYVALSTAKEAADRYAAPYDAGSTDLLGSALAGSFLQADLALCVNMEVVNEQVGNNIRSLKRLFEIVINQATDQNNLPGVSRRTLNAVRLTLKVAFQGIEDCRAVVLATEFRPEGLLLRVQARFAENTTTARLVRAETPDPLRDIGRLPTGFGSYVASRLGDGLRTVVEDLNQELAAAAGDQGGETRIDAYLKERAAAGPGSTWSADVSPGTAITVTSYKDPAKAVRVILDAYRAIGLDGTVDRVLVRGSPVVTEKAQRHRGFTFAEVRVPYDLETTAARAPDGPLKELMLGDLKSRFAERTAIWIGSDEKVVVRLAAKDWATAKAVIDKYLDGKEVVGVETGFQSTRRHLPAEAVYVTLEDTKSLISRMAPALRVAAKMLPGLPQMPELKSVKGDPTYVGLAFTLGGDNAGMTVFVPTAAMRVGRQMLAGPSDGGR